MNIPKHIDTAEEAEVFALQVGLKKIGYDPKGLDGKNGTNTRSALRRLVKRVTALNPKSSSKPLPLYAQIAHRYIGVKEVPGTKSNPLILGWIKAMFSWADDDSKVAWCAIFINQCLKEAGIKGTGKANARSFNDWGLKINPGAVRKGDIVVFSRGDPKGWQGHVGIYMGDAEPGRIFCLGGNQADKVSIKSYRSDRILSYRRPI